MEYEKTVHVSGDVAEAVKTVVQTLARHGFRITRKRDTSAELDGPGMNSSKENPLVGASKVHVKGRSGRLTVEAEFGAVRRLIRALGWMFIVMAVLFFVLFGFVLPVEGLVLRFVVPVASIAPWVILLPLMGRYFRSRCARALDVLVENAATLSENG
jgi:hypothetical protein